MQLAYTPQERHNTIQSLIGKNVPNYQSYVGYHGQPQPAYGPTGVPMPYQYYNYTQSNRKIPFLETLDFPYLSKLINDPILHDPLWPSIPVKLSSYIPKFDGKQGEDPKNHVMTFHLWCSSNSLMDDSIRLHLF